MNRHMKIHLKRSAKTNVADSFQRRSHLRQSRTTTGGVLLLAILILTFLVLPVGLCLYRYSMSYTTRDKYQSRVQAAALLVAERLSKIVVNDPHFGFIALSNCPPIGKGTMAEDGEPCPVTGINNLLATMRLDTLVAHEMNDSNFCALADADYNQTQAAATLLQSSLNASIDPKNKKKYYDIDGHAVTPLDDAQDLLKRNLQGAGFGHPAQVRNLRISLGWLSSGGSTNTPLPAPLDCAQLPPGSKQDGKYKSCVDLPAFGYSFYFAPVAKAPALADPAKFTNPDGKRFCSLVKVEADISYQDTNLYDPTARSEQWLHVSACAIPAEMLQAGPTGALVLVFPCGQTDLTDLHDVLTLEGGEETQSYQAMDGDIPIDANASTAPCELAPWGSQNITSNKVVAAGLYCWLRAAGVRPRIDTTINALSQQFQFSLKGNNLIYEFDSQGKVVISSLPALPLPISVVSDHQLFVETSCNNYTIGCYNNVYNLGTINGGKHAGQLLAGDPINWCDLSYFGLSPEQARDEGKGSATGLTATNEKDLITDIPGAVSKDLAQFEIDNKAIDAQPRKSYYSGGLAVELSISQL